MVRKATLCFFIYFILSSYTYAKPISYELPNPSKVRIRVGLREGPLYKTLIDWKEENKGKHQIDWDGADLSGSFNILGNPKATFTINYFPLGEDTLSPLDTTGELSFYTDPFIGRAPSALSLAQMHRKHKTNQCYDPIVEITFPENVEKTKEGWPIIKEVCPIRINLQEKDKWFNQERYALHIFIDNIFVKGQGEGYTPYSWNFNPQGINEGKHLILVNLRGLNDHIGVGSVVIFIKQPKKDENAK